MFILGLDISTSITGLSVIKSTDNFDPTKHLVFWQPIELTKFKSFWEKTDKVYNELNNLYELYPEIQTIYVEEPMKRFAVGLSSAQTVSILQRFNGIVCYNAYKRWNVEPTYVNVSSARKAIGIKIIQTKKDPQRRNAKQQTFDHITANDLKHIVWPVKRTGEVKNSCYDVVDSYVIAKGGMILNK